MRDAVDTIRFQRGPRKAFASCRRVPDSGSGLFQGRVRGHLDILSDATGANPTLKLRRRFAEVLVLAKPRGRGLASGARGRVRRTARASRLGSSLRQTQPVAVRTSDNQVERGNCRNCATAATAATAQLRDFDGRSTSGSTQKLTPAKLRHCGNCGNCATADPNAPLGRGRGGEWGLRNCGHCRNCATSSHEFALQPKQRRGENCGDCGTAETA